MIVPAVEEVVAALKVAPIDAGVVQLARDYARMVDDSGGDEEVLAKFGPKLLAALVELGATPRARAVVLRGGVLGGDDDRSGGSVLDELRDRRKRRASVVDSPAP